MFNSSTGRRMSLTNKKLNANAGGFSINDHIIRDVNFVSNGDGYIDDRDDDDTNPNTNTNNSHPHSNDNDSAIAPSTSNSYNDSVNVNVKNSSVHQAISPASSFAANNAFSQTTNTTSTPSSSFESSASPPKKVPVGSFSSTSATEFVAGVRVGGIQTENASTFSGDLRADDVISDAFPYIPQPSRDHDDIQRLDSAPHVSFVPKSKKPKAGRIVPVFEKDEDYYVNANSSDCGLHSGLHHDVPYPYVLDGNGVVTIPNSNSNSNSNSNNHNNGNNNNTSSASASASTTTIITPSPIDIATNPQHPPQIDLANNAPITPKSPASKHWAKIRLANKMSTALTSINEDIKTFGANANDDHIDWSSIYKRDNKVVESLTIIDPHGSFRVSWDLFMAAMLAYVAFYVPYRVCLFWDETDLPPALEAFELFSDICFGVDMVLNFNTAYYDEKQGRMVTSRRAIAKNYLKGYFTIDLVATFPFGLIVGGDNASFNKAGELSRLPRLIKFLRLMRLLKLLRVVRLQVFIARIETKYQLHAGFSKMSKIVLLVMLVTHIVGCMWFLIGDTSPDKTDPINGGWQWRNGYESHPLHEQYIASLYWAFSTLTTVGYGDISARTAPEQIFSMAMMLLGVSWYAYIVSSMSTIMNSFDRQNKAVKEKMTSVNAFIHDAKLPGQMGRDIRRYYDFLFGKSSNKSLLASSQYDADVILDELSSSLRCEVLLYVERDLISKIPFFKDKIPQFIADCITFFQPLIFHEGDFIIKEGTKADEMYFLIKGRGAVYYASRKQMSITEGSYFGEIGCILGGIRRAGIKAITMCEVQALSRRNLNVLLAEYPDVGEELRLVARARMTVRGKAAVDNGGVKAIAYGNDVEGEDTKSEVKGRKSVAAREKRKSRRSQDKKEKKEKEAAALVKITEEFKSATTESIDLEMKERMEKITKDFLARRK